MPRSRNVSNQIWTLRAGPASTTAGRGAAIKYPEVCRGRPRSQRSTTRTSGAPSTVTTTETYANPGARPFHGDGDCGRIGDRARNAAAGRGSAMHRRRNRAKLEETFGGSAHCAYGRGAIERPCTPAAPEVTILDERIGFI